jgi:hypothetical protein
MRFTWRESTVSFSIGASRLRSATRPAPQSCGVRVFGCSGRSAGRRRPPRPRLPFRLRRCASSRDRRAGRQRHRERLLGAWSEYGPQPDHSKARSKAPWSTRPHFTRGHRRVQPLRRAAKSQVSMLVGAPRRIALHRPARFVVRRSIQLSYGRAVGKPRTYQRAPDAARRSVARPRPWPGALTRCARGG